MRAARQGSAVGRALLSGFVQAVALSALGLGATLAFGLAYPPQLLFDRVTQLFGTPAMFQLVHATFGYGQGGKIAAFVAVALVWLGGLTVLRLAGPLFGAALVFLVAAPLAGLPAALVYTAVFVALSYALRPLEARPALEQTAGRRDALQVLAGGAALLLVGGAVPLLRGVLAPGSLTKSAAWTRSGTLPLGVTSQADLYYVSKNLEAFDPALDEAAWQLELRGLVNTPQTFSLADLKALPAVQSERTLHCISNPVGGPLIGNIVWTGLRVADLLKQAGVRSGAAWVVWHAADGYTESLPLDLALEDDVLLAYEANGAALERRHGYPLRVLIPDRLGMKQPKWLTAIEVTADEVPGYWAARGWTRTGYLETASRIDTPSAQNPVVTAGALAHIRGVAFAGTRIITQVEVSTDGGRTWQSASLRPKRSRYAWTLWQLAWTPSPGPHQLIVRAYAEGEQQTERVREALPEAATGWHRVSVVAA